MICPGNTHSFLLEDTNHLNAKHWGKFTTALKSINCVFEINPCIWHFPALLLHGDRKNCALLDSPAHEAISSADSFHRFIVCIPSTEHLMPIQQDLFPKEVSKPGFQGRVLRFANSYCKDILRLTKSLGFFVVVVLWFFSKPETKIMQNKSRNKL